MRARALAVLLFLLAPLPAAAQGPPAIHAHRGGPVLAGVPTFPEETMPAFRNAAREGYWLEMDAKITSDGVPVVFHDATLDRVTPCTGEVRARTVAELGDCRVDVLGSPGGGLPTKPTDPVEPIPTLIDALAFAREEGAFVNLEIKNQPTDPDFDDSRGFADRVMEVVLDSGFPKERLIVQSFWPPNLEVAQERLPGVETAFLTLSAANDGGPAFASSMGFEWVSPEWPVSTDYVQSARQAQRRIVPFTLNLQSEVRDAAALGLDALITDDPLMAQRALGLGRRALLPERLRPMALLDVPAYASNRSRSLRFRLGLAGQDRGSGVDSGSVEVRRNASAADRWRPLAGGLGSPPKFRGRPGVTYLFRLRVEDRMGNLSRYDYATTVVPLDDRSNAFRFKGGWRRVRSRQAWRGTLTRARGRGSVAAARVTGSRFALIARGGPGAGRVLVVVDGKPRARVNLEGPAAPRRVIYRSRALRPGEHRVAVRSLGGGPVDLDGLGIDEGPPAPRR